MNRILLIEDDPAGAVLLRRLCEEAKFTPKEFKVVTTLEEGLRLAQTETPDLILCDLVVPPIGEAECITKYLPAFSIIAPTGVWTGSVTPDIVMQCHAAGAHFCLIKQNLAMEKCGIERLGQAIGDAILNWRREYGRR